MLKIVHITFNVVLLFFRCLSQIPAHSYCKAIPTMDCQSAAGLFLLEYAATLMVPADYLGGGSDQETKDMTFCFEKDKDKDNILVDDILVILLEDIFRQLTLQG